VFDEVNVCLWEPQPSASTSGKLSLVQNILIWLRTRFFKNGLRDHDHAHYEMVCHPKANAIYILLVYKIYPYTNFDIPDISLGPQKLNGSHDPDHAPFISDYP